MKEKSRNFIEGKAVVEIEDGKIINRWDSIQKAAKDLFTTRQTVMNYCNNKTKKKMFNLMYEEDYKKKVNK